MKVDVSPGFSAITKTARNYEFMSSLGIILGPPPSATIESSFRSLLCRSKRHSFIQLCIVIIALTTYMQNHCHMHLKVFDLSLEG